VSVTIGGTAAVDQSNNPMGEVLVDAGQTFHCDLQSCFLEDLAPNTILEGFVQFEYATGGFPVAVVVSPDHENAIIVPYDNAGDTDRVFRHACHHQVSLVRCRQK
jgi:hypothetical protein